MHVLFRGMTDYGWVVGHYVEIRGEAYIFDGDTVVNGTYLIDVLQPVDKSTVGMWTGLTDRNGVKIFEGDTVSTNWGAKGKVVWRDGSASFSIFIEAEPPFHSKYFPLDDECEVLK